MNHPLLAGLPELLDDQTDSTDTDAVAVYDLATGERMSVSTAFKLLHRWIEVDPATRTGWAFGPSGFQTRLFSY